MKLKPLLTAIVILAAITGGAYWLQHKPAARPKAKAAALQEGDKLLSPDVVEKTSVIKFSKADDTKTVTLKKNEAGEWAVPEYYDMPVSSSKLYAVVNNLLDATVLRLVTSNPDAAKEYEIGQNRVTFAQSMDGSPLWEIETGKSGKSRGVFTRLNQGKDIYLADVSIYVDNAVENWPEKKVLEFKPEDVAEFSLELPNDAVPLHFTRKTKDDKFAADGMKENERVNDNELNRVMTSLLNARFTKAIKADDPDAVAAREKTRTFTFKLFDGDSYTLKIGRRAPQPLPAEPPINSSVEKPGEGNTAAGEPADEQPKVNIDIKEPEAASSNDTEAPAHRARPAGEPVAPHDAKTAATPKVTATAAGKNEPPKPEKPAAPKMSPGGPVCIFYDTTNAKFVWKPILEKVTLTYADYLYNGLPASRDKLIEPKPEENKPAELNLQTGAAAAPGTSAAPATEKSGEGKRVMMPPVKIEAGALENTSLSPAEPPPVEINVTPEKDKKPAPPTLNMEGEKTPPASEPKKNESAQTPQADTQEKHPIPLIPSTSETK